MSNQSISGASKAAIVIGTALFLVAAFALANFVGDDVEDMPPDPFEGQEPREVVVEVTWDGDPGREQFIFWRIGEENDELRTFGETADGFGGWVFSHTGIGFKGEPVLIRSAQSAPGPVDCDIYVDEELVYDHQGSGPMGCEAQGLIP